jgi:putative flippase GtrA
MNAPREIIGQAVWYIIIGGATALIYVLVCTILTQQGIRAGIASLIGYLLVILPAYFGQKLLTFRSPAWHRIALPRYVTLQMMGNIAGFVLSERLISSGFPVWCTFTAVAILVATMNFAAMKYWAFRRHA